MKEYVIALDQGTSSSRAIVFDRRGRACATCQKEFTQHFPKPGMVEHDPMEIWATEYAVMTEAVTSLGLGGADIAAIGITNQRETTIVWDAATGKPVCNAIVWQDRRTSEYCDSLKAQGLTEMIREKTGLIPDAYFSGTKIRWILENVPGARARAERGELRFGTVDSWLVWKLTGGAASTSYTSEDMLASCFDDDIVFAMGASIGNDCLMANRKAYSGIYGPGANIHRTPYSGRNFEYYSEDPFVSGKTCAAETAGIQSKGVYVYLKHFAMNDQETGRDGICVWTNEQAAREIYLQAFEYPIEEANAYCVMTSFNRMGPVWAGGDFNLLTNILRGEWDMAGFAITDFSNNNNFMDVVQGVLAGGDAWDCNDDGKWVAKLANYENDPQVVSAMREATKRILYTVANSNAMNGASLNTHEVEVKAPWESWIRYGQVVTGAAAALFLLVSIFSSVNAKKKAATSR